MEWSLQLSTWDGRPTRRIPLRPLDTDRHGSWWRWPAGAPALDADDAPHGEPRHHHVDVVVLVAAHGGWIARFGGDGAVDVQVKVTTATAVTDRGIGAVEMDLDVVRFRTGRVAVVDQDGFDDRRLVLGYPADLVGRALSTARHLYRALARRDEPFDRDGARRLAALHRHDHRVPVAG